MLPLLWRAEPLLGCAACDLGGERCVSSRTVYREGARAGGLLAISPVVYRYTGSGGGEGAGISEAE
jgi:hypothetical protein